MSTVNERDISQDHVYSLKAYETTFTHFFGWPGICNRNNSTDLRVGLYKKSCAAHGWKLVCSFKGISSLSQGQVKGLE